VKDYKLYLRKNTRKIKNSKENINKVIGEIPKEKYENIFKGAYERPEKYVPKNKTSSINNFCIV
jgi:hypothetical protein